MKNIKDAKNNELNEGDIIKDNIKVFDNNVCIGDRFYCGKNLEAIVVDILSHWSLKDYDWTGNVTYIAKLTNGQATNTFDVCKVTIVRNRITI